MEIEDIRVKTVTRKNKSKFLWFTYDITNHVEHIFQVKYKGGEWQMVNNKKVIEFI